MLIKDKQGIWVQETQKENIHYPETDYDFTFQIEDSSFWFKHRNEIILATMKKIPFAKNFADVGGGNGLQVKFLSENLPGKSIFLVEPAYRGCLNARKRNVEEVYNIFARDFSFTDFNVNGIGLFDVVEHIEDDVKFLKEISSMVEKGTRIYLTVPAYNWLWSDVDDYSKHFRRYNGKMIFQLAKNAGLKILFSAKYFFYLPFFSFPLRSVPYLFSRKRTDIVILPQMLENHQTGKISGKVFEFFNKTELSFFTRRKISFGASCMAVFEV